jgi:hypothetical protein
MRIAIDGDWSNASQCFHYETRSRAVWSEYLKQPIYVARPIERRRHTLS